MGPILKFFKVRARVICPFDFFPSLWPVGLVVDSAYVTNLEYFLVRISSNQNESLPKEHRKSGVLVYRHRYHMAGSCRAGFRLVGALGQSNWWGPHQLGPHQGSIARQTYKKMQLHLLLPLP